MSMKITFDPTIDLTLIVLLALLLLVLGVVVDWCISTYCMHLPEEYRYLWILICAGVGDTLTILLAAPIIGKENALVVLLAFLLSGIPIAFGVARRLLRQPLPKLEPFVKHEER